MPVRQRTGKKKFIDTNDSFYQPFILHYTQPAIKEVALAHPEFVPRPLTSGKLSASQIAVSTKIAILLLVRSPTSKLSAFETGLFASLRKASPDLQLEQAEELLNAAKSLPAKQKQFMQAFAECVSLNSELVADSVDLYNRLMDFLLRWNIFSPAVVDMVGNCSNRLMRKHPGLLPEGYSVLMGLASVPESRPLALKNLLLIDHQSTIDFIYEQEFDPADSQMLQEGAQIKLTLINQEPVQKLDVCTKLILGVCSLSSGMWAKVYHKSQNFTEGVWQFFVKRLLSVLKDKDVLRQHYQHIVYDAGNSRYNKALLSQLVALLAQSQVMLKNHKVRDFFANELLQNMEQGEDVSWVISEENKDLLEIVVSKMEFYRNNWAKIITLLAELKPRHPLYYLSVFIQLIANDLLLQFQEHLPILLKPFSNDETLNLLKELSKKEAQGSKWFMSCLLWNWLNPERKRHLKEDLLRLANSVAKRRESKQPGQDSKLMSVEREFWRGMARFWSLLTEKERLKIIEGICEDPKHFEHVYLE